MARRKVRPIPNPTYVRQRLEHFRDDCISMEKSGNHGYYGGGPGDDADMRRFIAFWGSGRGWQLYKDWREEWAKKYPDIELPPAPPPKRKPKRVLRAKLEALVAEYKSFRHDVSGITYFDDKPYGWQLEIHHPKHKVDPNTGEEWDEPDWDFVSLGSNSETAEYHLRQEIERWKRDHGLSGQEPSLGGQAERSGQEPMISRKDGTQ